MDQKNYLITYTGDLRVELTHLKSSSVIYTDAPTDNNGKGEAFSPTDLLASSLVSCILTIAGIHYDKKGIRLLPIKCEVRKVMFSAPRRVGEIHIAFDFGENNFEEKEVKIMRHIVETCPVSLSLNPEIKVVTNL